MEEFGGGMSIMDREVCERCGNLCYLFVYEKEHLVKIINASCGFDSLIFGKNADESDGVISRDCSTGRMKRMNWDESAWKVDFEWTYDSFLPSEKLSCPKYAEHLVSALNKT